MPDDLPGAARPTRPAAGRPVPPGERYRRLNDALTGLMQHPWETEGGLPSLFREVTEAVARVLDAELVSVWLVDDRAGRLRCVDFHDAVARTHEEGLELDLAACPVYVEALRSERCIAAHDALTDPRTREFRESYLVPHGITSMLDAQLRVEGEPVGVICVEHVGPPRTWDQESQVTAGAVADFLSLQLEADRRRQAEGEVRQLAADLERRVRDRTRALEAANEALREARDRAEAATRAKSTFLANMSHEIRTPLHGVLGMLDLLARTKTTPRQREWLATATTSAETLLAVLNDVLDLSKIEAGALPMEHAPFAPASELEAVVRLHAANAARKGVLLEAVVDASVPPAVVGDPLRFRQIVSNLVSNAVKFTDAGRVTARLDAAPEPSRDRVRLHLAVEDTGSGLEPAALERVFLPFVQADPSMTREHGGTGLGLAIVRQLVERMDGRVWATSAPDAGSTFHVEVVLAVGADAPAPADAPPGARPPPTRPLRVLVVEDNVVNQQVVRRLLEMRGHAVAIVGDGQAGLDRLERESFDVVLMDVQMPVLDGLAATERLRAREAAGGRPRQRVIGLTAHAMAGDRELCLAAGMDDYLAKPFQADALLALVEAAAGPSAPAGPRPDAPPADLDGALDRLGGLDAVLAEAARTWRAGWHEVLDALDAALAAADGEVVRARAHDLKGVLGLFGADRARDLALVLEQQGRQGRLEGADVRLAALRTDLERLDAQLAAWLAARGKTPS